MKRRRLLYTWGLALLAATSVYAAPLIHLTDAGTLRFDVSDVGRVSIGPTLATIERFLLEDVTLGERTFTVRSVAPDGVTMRDRIILEKNLSDPYDLNFRNVVMQVGSTSAAASSAVPILNYTATGAFGAQYTMYKPGSSTLPAMSIMATGQIRSYTEALTTYAWMVGAYADANPKFAVNGANGNFTWGPGGATVMDTTLYRVSANKLGTLGDLQVAGKITGNVLGTVTPINTNTTLGGNEGLVVADTTTGIITATLPSATGNAGIKLFLKRGAAGTNDANLNAAGTDTIDGVGSKALKAQGAGVQVESDGAGHWLIITNLGTVQ